MHTLVCVLSLDTNVLSHHVSWMGTEDPSPGLAPRPLGLQKQRWVRAAHDKLSEDGSCNPVTTPGELAWASGCSRRDAGPQATSNLARSCSRALPSPGKSTDKTNDKVAQRKQHTGCKGNAGLSYLNPQPT